MTELWIGLLGAAVSALCVAGLLLMFKVQDLEDRLNEKDQH